VAIAVGKVTKQLQNILGFLEHNVCGKKAKGKVTLKESYDSDF